MNNIRKNIEPSKGEIVIYRTRDRRVNLEVKLEQDTVWLSQKQMSSLFIKDIRTINEHIQNIFKEKELSRYSVIRKFRITAADGKSYETYGIFEVAGPASGIFLRSRASKTPESPATEKSCRKISSPKHTTVVDNSSLKIRMG